MQMSTTRRLPPLTTPNDFYLSIYLGFYVAFNTVQVISRRVVGMAEETSTYSSSGFCTVNYRPTASNYQLSHLRPYREPNPGLRGGRREWTSNEHLIPKQECVTTFKGVASPSINHRYHCDTTVPTVSVHQISEDMTLPQRHFRR